MDERSLLAVFCVFFSALMKDLFRIIDFLLGCSLSNSMNRTFSWRRLTKGPRFPCVWP